MLTEEDLKPCLSLKEDELKVFCKMYCSVDGRRQKMSSAEETLTIFHKDVHPLMEEDQKCLLPLLFPVSKSACITSP